MYRVLDTNVLLLDSNNLLTLGEDGCVVVLPETVLEELDAKKSGFGEINYQARAFGRLLTKAEVSSIDKENGATITTLALDDVCVQVVMLDTYGADKDGASYNDQKILEVAMYYSRLHEDVEFVSEDVMARLRGLAMGLDVRGLKVANDSEAEFVKSMELDDDEMFRTLHNRSVYDVDADHKPQNFSYVFENVNTGQVKLATISNGIVSVLGKDSERELRRQMVNPMGIEQLLMSKAIQDPTIDIVLCEASAGSGKTAMAISNAMRLMDLNKDLYDGIIYMRNTVDDYSNEDENVGFLPGLEEKFAVYLGPLQDTLDFMVRDKLKKNKAKGAELEEKVSNGIDELTAKYNIQSMVALGQRGRTYTNSIVILDEAQNMGPATMQKLLSRVGKHCKVIIVGSNKQIDSKFLSKYNNGMSVLLSEASEPTIQTGVNMFAITLKKVARSEICEFAEQLFSKGR